MKEELTSNQMFVPTLGQTVTFAETDAEVIFVDTAAAKLRFKDGTEIAVPFDQIKPK